MRPISIEDPVEVLQHDADKAKPFAPPARILGEVANHLARQESVLVLASDYSYAPFCRIIGGHYAQFADGKAAFHHYGSTPMWVIELSGDKPTSDGFLQLAGVPRRPMLIVVDGFDELGSVFPGLLSYLASQSMHRVPVVYTDGEPTIAAILKSLAYDANRSCGQSYDLFVDHFSIAVDSHWPFGAPYREEVVTMARAMGYESTEERQARTKAHAGGACSDGIDPGCGPAGFGRIE
ncbi:hypothetical protein [Paraburkholderia sp. A3RO-2L]|jgi:hypothetical protein|uniref:hypothetical protein n=1 Tax=unclassified Paraburkholderia TaxID=2615204 RepID=UPI003DAA301A